ncbi:MAG: hypothetical protein AAGD11_00885 [Planctomycetota bacterium]
MTVNSGQTNIAFDFDELRDEANLDFIEFSRLVGPGEFDGAVSFGFATRTARPQRLATSMSFDLQDLLGTVTGSIGHVGNVLFADDKSFGLFGFEYDSSRTSPTTSGFFLEGRLQNLGSFTTVLFDVSNAEISSNASLLEISGDLLIAPEFADMLIERSLTTSDLTGRDVGDLLLRAAVPEPNTATILFLVIVPLVSTRVACRRLRTSGSLSRPMSTRVPLCAGAA